MRTSKNLAILFLILAASAPALACSCFESSGTTSCSLFFYTPAIFAGKATAVAEVKEGNRHFRQFKFSVIDPLRGVEEKEVTVSTGLGGGDCGYSFEVGASYLVYAGEEGGEYWASICSHTKPLKEAGEEIAAFHELLKSPLTSSIFGSVSRLEYDSLNEERTPMARIEMRATSDTGKVSSARTAADGRFSIKGLEPGTYTVKPRLASALTLAEEAQPIELKPQSCEQLEFTVLQNGRISGTATNSDGSLAVKAELGIVNLDHDAVYMNQTKTDENGHFEFRGLADGEYALAVNQYFPTDESPYPRRYYPDSTTEKGAEHFQVNPAHPIENVFFRLPPRMRRIQIAVQLLLPDGGPAAGKSLEVLDKEVTDRPTFLKADNDGRVMATLFERRNYVLTAIGHSGHSSACVGKLDVAPEEDKPVVIKIVKDGNCTID